MRQMSRTVQVSSAQHESSRVRPDSLQYTSSFNLDSNHCAKDSYSTLNSFNSSINVDPFLDGVEAAERDLGCYTGPIPSILVQKKRSMIREDCIIHRPASVASTNLSHVTSHISFDSDQIHTATAQLMEASLGPMQAGQARLIRLPSDSLQCLPGIYQSPRSPDSPSFQLQPAPVSSSIRTPLYGSSSYQSQVPLLLFGERMASPTSAIPQINPKSQDSLALKGESSPEDGEPQVKKEKATRRIPSHPK